MATFIEEEKHFSGKYARQVFETIGFAYRPYRALSVFILVIGLFARALLLLNANVMGYWADSLCKGPLCKPVPSMFAYFGAREFVTLLLTITTLGFLLNTFFRVGIARLGTHAISHFYDEVTLRTSRLPLSFFDRTPVGRMIARFSSDYSAVFRMAGGPMGEFACICFDLVLTLVLISVASPLYIPLVLLTVGANLVVYRLNNTRMRQERRAMSVTRAPAIAHFAETAQGARTIRAFGKAQLFASRFCRLVRHFLSQRARTLVVIQAFSLQMSFITSLLLLCTGLLGIFFVREGWVSVGSVAVAFTFVMMTSSTVQLLFEYLASFEEALTGVERLDDYLRRDLEPGAKLPPTAIFPTSHPRMATLPPPEPAAAGALEVSGLVLRYRPELPQVLRGVSFALRPGEHVGVVGRTGCGKSSLIQALFLLYPWEAGWVELDGRRPEIFAGKTTDRARAAKNPLSLDAYRANLSLIPQEPSLFRGTLRENLVADKRVSDDEIESVLACVGLSEWFASLGPKPFHMAIEERGGNLSSGQRQLLCMARCLMQKSSIVVMDEATSSVDPVSEENLLHATRDLLAKRTQIIVAHRLSTIEHCDRILWLQEGLLYRQGPPSVILPEYRATRSSHDV